MVGVKTRRVCGFGYGVYRYQSAVSYPYTTHTCHMGLAGFLAYLFIFFCSTTVLIQIVQRLRVAEPPDNTEIGHCYGSRCHLPAAIKSQGRKND